MLAAITNFLACNTGGDQFTQGISTNVAKPLLIGAQLLIPAGVATAGLHKLMQHQETGGGFLVDMLVKGGGAFLVIQLIRALICI